MNIDDGNFASETNGHCRNNINKNIWIHVVRNQEEKGNKEKGKFQAEIQKKRVVWADMSLTDINKVLKLEDTKTEILDSVQHIQINPLQVLEKCGQVRVFFTLNLMPISVRQVRKMEGEYNTLSI